MEDTSWWVGPRDAPDTYEITRVLGSGGEAEVWRAVLPLSKSGRHEVAIKMMRTAASASVDVDAWTRFGHLLQALGHPGLVRVTSAFVGAEPHLHGMSAGSTEVRYLVMDLINGLNLTEWIGDNPGATVSTRLGLLRTVAAAVDEMHSGTRTGVPVAHGDIKPSNIVVTPQGRSVLVDLGLARLSDGVGVVGHSKRYAAPELRTASARTTPTTDVFAFVATTAEVLLGEPLPVRPDGYLDTRRLTQALRTAEHTRHRSVLVDHVVAVLRATPEARPASVGRWLEVATSSAGNETGPPVVGVHFGVPARSQQVPLLPAQSPDGDRSANLAPPAVKPRGRRVELVVGASTVVAFAVAASVWALTSVSGGPSRSSGDAAALATSPARCSAGPVVDGVPEQTANPRFTLTVAIPCPALAANQRWVVEELLDIGSTDLHSEYYPQAQLDPSAHSVSVPMNVTPSLGMHRRIYVIELTPAARHELATAEKTDSGDGYWGPTAISIFNGNVVSNICSNYVPA